MHKSPAFRVRFTGPRLKEPRAWVTALTELRLKMASFKMTSPAPTVGSGWASMS